METTITDILFGPKKSTLFDESVDACPFGRNEKSEFKCNFEDLRGDGALFNADVLAACVDMSDYDQLVKLLSMKKQLTENELPRERRITWHADAKETREYNSLSVDLVPMAPGVKYGPKGEDFIKQLVSAALNEGQDKERAMEILIRLIVALEKSLAMAWIMRKRIDKDVDLSIDIVMSKYNKAAKKRTYKSVAKHTVSSRKRKPRKPKNPKQRVKLMNADTMGHMMDCMRQGFIFRQKARFVLGALGIELPCSMYADPYHEMVVTEKLPCIDIWIETLRQLGVQETENVLY